MNKINKLWRGTVDWTSYANVYDLMSENNPAYQDLVRDFSLELSTWKLGPGEHIVELGAGTGNFSVTAAAQLPHCYVRHMERNKTMNQIAEQKATTRKLTNIAIMQQDVTKLVLPPNSVGAFICIHALYALPQPKQLIDTMYASLRSGGYMFMCDPGSVINVWDWAKYLFRESLRRQGFFRTINLFVRGRQIIWQNLSVAKMQRENQYWHHTLPEFVQTFEAAGFSITKSYVTYRGYSDVVLCCKP